MGSWILFVDQSDAILCNDGTSVPGRNNYSWDATSLSGYASIFSGGACNAAPQSLAIPFKLTKTGSGPIQYPTEPVEAQPYVPPAPEPPLSHPPDRCRPSPTRPSWLSRLSCPPAATSADRSGGRRAGIQREWWRRRAPLNEPATDTGDTTHPLRRWIEAKAHLLA